MLGRRYYIEHKITLPSGLEIYVRDSYDSIIKASWHARRVSMTSPTVLWRTVSYDTDQLIARYSEGRCLGRKYLDVVK